ncbi:DUF427 domain-containing protein [Sciscionella sediminilitoris]|uniref:DUF427 domain-containing protein n=1 Tax=Sciscionella sediminilitoris TaxID=1445613 RepID=UPI0004DF6EFB|nr:DUF427 domain-containing protein [Sciscionella sp. SE31]
MAGHEIITERPGYRVQVRIDGETVADSERAVTLAETGYPLRHYLPRADVRMELLTRSETSTHCPFKGDAEYFGYPGYPDVAWSYAGENALRADITDLICFADERVEVTAER